MFAIKPYISCSFAHFFQMVVFPKKSRVLDQFTFLYYQKLSCHAYLKKKEDKLLVCWLLGVPRKRSQDHFSAQSLGFIISKRDSYQLGHHWTDRAEAV